jgi:hypothetical protein
MGLQAAFYKGTRSGLAGVYNRGVRLWTASEYSHCELSFVEGFSGSASYMDGGVRLKPIDYDLEKWDLLDLPESFAKPAFEWFMRHRGEKYDLLGNLHFVVAPVMGGRDTWFCSEAIAAALGMSDPWRYDPATLHSALQLIALKGKK